VFEPALYWIYISSTLRDIRDLYLQWAFGLRTCPKYFGHCGKEETHHQFFIAPINLWLRVYIIILYNIVVSHIMRSCVTEQAYSPIFSNTMWILDFLTHFLDFRRYMDYIPVHGFYSTRHTLHYTSHFTLCYILSDTRHTSTMYGIYATRHTLLYESPMHGLYSTTYPTLHAILYFTQLYFTQYTLWYTIYSPMRGLYSSTRHTLHGILYNTTLCEF